VIESAAIGTPGVDEPHLCTRHVDGDRAINYGSVRSGDQGVTHGGVTRSGELGRPRYGVPSRAPTAPDLRVQFLLLTSICPVPA
jgi:hypothetical protein